MSDLVVNNADFSCSFCSGGLKLKVANSSTTGDGKKIANQTNCFMPPPGGTCSLISGIPPPPCPGVPIGCVTSTGQSTVKVDGQKALGKGSTCMCPLGQSVSLSAAGQTIVKHNTAQGPQEAIVAVGYTITSKLSGRTYEVTASKFWEPRVGEKVVAANDNNAAANDNNKQAANDNDASEVKSNKTNVKEYRLKEYQTRSNKKRGTDVHKEYRKLHEDKTKGKIGEVSPYGSKKRMDLIDYSSDPIRVTELKPNNPAAIAQGQKQLDMYIELLKNDPDLKGKSFIGVIEVY